MRNIAIYIVEMVGYCGINSKLHQTQKGYFIEWLSDKIFAVK